MIFSTPNSEAAAKTSSAVAVDFEYTQQLPELLAQLDISLLLSTYQAGRLVSVGSYQGQLVIRFAQFDQVMGLARTPTGLAVGSRNDIWMLPASREIAPSFKPLHQHDVAFLTRTSYRTGPVMGHDLAWGDGRLWIVNTLFNSLCTLEKPWSFVPQWQPPFITAIAPGDRCHLNGLAVAENDGPPAYVTALGISDEENGWRKNKRNGGCLIDVSSGEILRQDLSMPHSPRLYQGQLLFLDSGHGHICHIDPYTFRTEVIATLPGFTRGLDCFAGYAAVGLSRIRETSVFGGLPIQETHRKLRCGIALVHLASGTITGTLFFGSGVEELFAVSILPGFRNPVVIGPNPDIDDIENPWLVPQMPNPAATLRPLDNGAPH